MVPLQIDPGRKGQLEALTGVVWEACDRASKVPIDNKTAMVRRLTHSAKALKDALQEVMATPRTYRAPSSLRPHRPSYNTVTMPPLMLFHPFEILHCPSLPLIIIGFSESSLCHTPESFLTATTVCRCKSLSIPLQSHRPLRIL